MIKEIVFILQFIFFYLTFSLTRPILLLHTEPIQLKRKILMKIDLSTFWGVEIEANSSNSIKYNEKRKFPSGASFHQNDILFQLRCSFSPLYQPTLEPVQTNNKPLPIFSRRLLHHLRHPQYWRHPTKFQPFFQHLLELDFILNKFLWYCH